MGAVRHDDVTPFSLDILVDMVKIDQVAMVDPEEMMGQELGFIGGHGPAGGVLLIILRVEVGIGTIGLEVQDITDVQEEQLLVHGQDDFAGMGRMVIISSGRGTFFPFLLKAF